MDRRERALIAAALAALAVLPIAVFLLWRDDGEESPVPKANAAKPKASLLIAEIFMSYSQEK